MNLEELFLTRQSTREFCDKPVADEVIEKICRLAILAPSAINAQPWDLNAVNGDKAKEFAKFVQKDGANGWADGAKAYIVIKQRPAHAVMRGERRVSNEEFISNDRNSNRISDACRRKYGCADLHNRLAGRKRNCGFSRIAARHSLPPCRCAGL